MISAATASKTTTRKAVRNYGNKIRQRIVFTRQWIADDSNARFSIAFIEMWRLTKTWIWTSCREACIWICQAVLLLMGNTWSHWLFFDAHFRTRLGASCGSVLTLVLSIHISRVYLLLGITKSHEISFICCSINLRFRTIRILILLNYLFYFERFCHEACVLVIW